MRLKYLFSFLLVFAVFMLLGGSARTATRKTHEKSSSKTKFSCSPEKLFSGDTLTIDMSIPHGGDLAITDPDGKFFFVVYQPDTSEKSSMRQPFMKIETFKNLSQLKLPTTLSATLMSKDGKGNQAVFTKTGWYKLLLSENLETDIGIPVYECKVYYSNHR
jgi:hypothetical protein